MSHLITGTSHLVATSYSYESFQVDDRHIEIRNARLSDSGSYECLVENEAGQAKKTFELAVLGSFFHIMFKYSFACSVF